MNEDDIKDPEDDRIFEEVMQRAIVAQAFKEFYKRDLLSVKFELKKTNQQLMQASNYRGQQRILHKKKYKTLGELSSLAKVLTILEENKKMMSMPENVSQSNHLNPKKAPVQRMSIISMGSQRP